MDFLTGMIPHHQAAVDMAESYLKYGGENKELKELAENIIEVQREEIDQMEKMAGSLKEKGTHNEDQAKAYRQEYDKMFEDGAHGHHMPDSSPATVDEAFAEGMMMHHQMAVDMARSILEYTDDEEVTQLANAIVEQQEVEISQMKGILEGLQPVSYTHLSYNRKSPYPRLFAPGRSDCGIVSTFHPSGYTLSPPRCTASNRRSGR